MLFKALFVQKENTCLDMHKRNYEKKQQKVTRLLLTKGRASGTIHMRDGIAKN